MSVEEKINEITEVFGMKASVCAKAMNITPGTFRKKKSDKSLDHNFNQKNLDDLIEYVKKEAEKL